jgi:phage RecT family recombinase
MSGKDLAVSSNNFIEAFQSKPEVKEALASYLGGPEKISKFVGAMRMCFMKNPKLNKCTKASLAGVFLDCVSWSLFPSPVTGEAYVIPYGDTATFQLGYQGMVTLGYRAGLKMIDAHIVYSKDEFKHSFGLKPTLLHEPDPFAEDRGEPIGAYAMAILESGESVFKVMGKEAIFKFREKSQGWKNDNKYKKKDSPWQEINDPQLNMWKKTCIKQLFKLLPKSSILQQAIAADTKGDVIDVTPDSTFMSDDAIATYRSRLIDEEGYTEAELKKARVQAINRDKFGKLTIDEAELIEKQLKQNRDEQTIDVDNSEEDKQGAML